MGSARQRDVSGHRIDSAAASHVVTSAARRAVARALLGARATRMIELIAPNSLFSEDDRRSTFAHERFLPRTQVPQLDVFTLSTPTSSRDDDAIRARAARPVCLAPLGQARAQVNFENDLSHVESLHLVVRIDLARVEIAARIGGHHVQGVEAAAVATEIANPC